MNRAEILVLDKTDACLSENQEKNYGFWNQGY